MVGLLAVGNGCYAYTPTGIGQLPRGRDVHLGLTDAGSVALAAQVGPSVVALDGRLVADSTDHLVLAVTSATARDGNTSDWHGEPVRIAHEYVASGATRRFARARTAFFSLAMGGALAVITAAFSGAGGAGAPGTTPGGPQTGK